MGSLPEMLIPKASLFQRLMFFGLLYIGQRQMGPSLRDYQVVVVPGPCVLDLLYKAKGRWAPSPSCLYQEGPCSNISSVLILEWFVNSAPLFALFEGSLPF